MIKYLLTDNCCVDINNLDENEKVVFDECSGTNLPFIFGVKYGHSSIDLDRTMLTTKELVYQDELWRKFVNITFYNQDKEILNENEYATFNNKKDSKYKSIEVGCFENFFSLIVYTESKINGKFQNDLHLVCYTYDGQLIGTHTPLAPRFGDYTHQQLKEFITTVENEISKQEELTM